MSKLVPVILAGGAGTRLWPESRRAYPKPFMHLADGQTLLEKTLRRAQALTDQSNILTVTAEDYYFITRDLYQSMGAEQEQLHYLLEPVGRNTAPAIALAARYIAQHWGEDAQLLVLPADHLIHDQQGFAQAVARARQLAQDGYLVTFGIQPSRAETGYGYIRKGEQISANGHNIARFVEKPPQQTAQEYVDSGQYLWNSGMFCFSARSLMAALDTHQPKLGEQAQQCWSASTQDKTPVTLDHDSFAAMEALSIDYAVMEKASNAAIVDGNFDWSDIGSWQAISELFESDARGNRVKGRAITIDSDNCFIHARQRLVSTVGVNNLLVIDTEDALLIADQKCAQDVKKIVDHLHAEQDEVAVYHRTVYRPWGSYTILEDADDCKVKRLVVKPGQVLSLQKHQRRSEHWTVVQGSAKVRVGDEEFLLQQNQSTHIPVNTLHRLENPTEEDIALIEVQCGDYFGEDDIERFEDIYGRR